MIETLGMAADVEAPRPGRLDRFLAEDGQAVEFGQVLAIIVPRKRAEACPAPGPLRSGPAGESRPGGRARRGPGRRPPRRPRPARPAPRFPEHPLHLVAPQPQAGLLHHLGLAESALAVDDPT